MKLAVVAVGHRMPAWIGAGWSEYARRVPREFGLELVELRPEPRDRGRTIAQILAAEAVRIEAACGRSRVVALDERGAPWTTRSFADALVRWRRDGDDVAFVIGSADGLAETVRKKAAAVVALSALTLPHGLVRVIVAEQLYRAATIVSGHPYHRE